MTYFTSNGSYGVTFLEWSVHYLSGKNIYYNIEDKQNYVLTHSPLQGNTAHNHKKNHPRLGLDCENTLNELEKSRLNNQNTDISAYLFVSPEIFLSERIKVFQILKNYCSNNGKKLIFLNETTSIPLAHELKPHPNQPPKTQLERYINHEKYFDKQFTMFPNFKNCKTIPEIREILSYRILKIVNDQKNMSKELNEIFHSSKLIKNISNKDLYLNGLDVLVDTLNFLKMTLDSNRINQWTTIYKTWSSQFRSKIIFYDKISEIAECVVENKFHSLENYELNINDEAFLMNYLMIHYKKKLKLKNLEEFPKNTLELHQYL
jgi:hypothetical protein